MPGRKKKLNTILKAFGVDKNNRADFRSAHQGEDLKSIYQGLQDKKGTHQKLSFNAFQGDHPNQYGLGDFGLPIGYVKKARNHAQDAAANDLAYLDTYNNADYSTGQQRGTQDYQTGLDALLTNYNRNLSDYGTNRDRLTQDYGTSVQQNDFNNTLQNEGLSNSLAASGNYDSGQQGLQEGRLAQQQGWARGGIDNVYNRGIQDLNTSQDRTTQDYGTNTQLYNRNYDRSVYDLNQMYQRNQDQNQRSQNQTADQYLYDEVNNKINQ